MNGILILDKPAGITSHDACDVVKGKLGIEKAGHAGTLDPDVTGVLVIALNDAVKILRLLSGLPKEYVGVAKLHQDISQEKLEQVIEKKFLGVIKQTPPKRSRVKRVEREREVFDFEVLEKNGRDFTFQVLCQAGTYIRKLMDDLGKELGIGCHMTSLRRITQGPFSEKESIKVDDLKNEGKLKKSLLSIEETIKRLKTKTIKLNEKQEEDIKHGRFLDTKVDIEGGKIFVALNHEGKVIALMIKEGERIKPERVFINEI
ncbi:MAG: RNA-guided pseudouridylation complex pseudouridine synthase subunit Cbf5 [Candidatus Pacearchaeota archaeon]|nr:RNA-guided pseudouridylation complex pseudouridine synthase subunit Cbf5 [Candidatus Pacearchaeota archaeon]